MGSSNCEVVSCNKKKEETRPARQANFLMELVLQNVAFAELDCICFCTTDVRLSTFINDTITPFVWNTGSVKGQLEAKLHKK